MGLLALLAVALVASCRDPAAGPPGHRELGPAQAARLEAMTLREPPGPRFPLAATLGARGPPAGADPAAPLAGSATLLGLDVEPFPPTAGAPVELTWYLRCDAPFDRDERLFVHGEQQGRGGRVNGDHPLLEGLLATTRWKPGVVYADRHTIVFPPEPAPLQLYVGMYRWERRLAAGPSAATDGHDRIRGPLLLPGPPSPPIRYLAPKAARPPTIDGLLDDPVWLLAPPSSRFVRSLDGAAAPLATEARVAWDDAHLYVAFRVEDPDVWAGLRDDDAALYGEEVVELFLDADGDGGSYLELELSPAGVKLDASFTGPRRGMELAFDLGLTRAVHVDGTLDDPTDVDRGWTVEVALPLERLGLSRLPPGPGDELRANFYRLEWADGRKRQEGYAWSPPLVGDFHLPARFGVIELGPAR